jgi:hypothetical protein
MINVNDANLYQASCNELAGFRHRVGRRLRGRFIQLFLALKFYQDDIPSMFSNQFISSEVFQTLLDDLYAKASRQLTDGVLMLFENSYLARTGLIAPGNTTAQNTWRNNLHLQKGIACYAPPQELSSQTFLDQSRSNCRHLIPGPGGGLAGGTCELCRTNARYRNEDHRKWLRIDPGGSGYAVVDLMNISNFIPYIVPDEQKIPIIPLIGALYFDALPGLSISGRHEVDIAHFANDFHFNREELREYFDDNHQNMHNQTILNSFPQITYSRFSALITPTPPAILPPRARPRLGGRVQRLPGAIPTPVLTGTPTVPPGINTGWDAEAFVAETLRSAGWTVHDVSRQRVGYDLLAQRGRETRYIDAKSSINYCSPGLTSREWQQARTHGANYILAIIENFDPLGQNVIYWVPNPHGRCTATELTSIQYTISRSSWTAATVPMADVF